MLTSQSKRYGFILIVVALSVLNACKTSKGERNFSTTESSSLSQQDKALNLTWNPKRMLHVGDEPSLEVLEQGIKATQSKHFRFVNRSEVPVTEQAFQLKHQKVSSAGHHFENDEDFVYLSLPTQDKLVGELSLGQSVVRNNTEYYVLHKGDTHSILAAVNLKPRFRSLSSIRESLDNFGETFPEHNFRLDPQFQLKKETTQSFVSKFMSTHEIMGELDNGTKYEIVKQAAGTYGLVHVVNFRISADESFQMAFKQLDVNTRTKIQNTDRAVHFEIQATEAMSRHPHSIPYFGTIKKEDPKGGSSYFLALEAMDTTLVRKTGLTEEQLIKAKIDAAEALNALHTAGFNHNDLHTENFMFDKDGNIFLTDLGSVGGRRNQDHSKDIKQLAEALETLNNNNKGDNVRVSATEVLLLQNVKNNPQSYSAIEIANSLRSYYKS